MKIESSEVNLNAKTDFKLEQKHSSEFVSQLIETKLSQKDIIKKQNYVKLEVTKLEKVLLSSEKDLTHQDRIKKNILETILSHFTDDKNFKIHPKDEKITSLNNKLIRIEESNFKYTREYTQESSIEFTTQALVNTNRGQINIDLNLSFSQSFYEKHQEELNSRKTTYLDPLIINYNSDLTSFDNISSSIKFEFDLNSDGKNELIASLKEGTGFLALDKNKNNTIDNGSELFGASTGDGFEELRKYDNDNNSWIDENDDIFDNLLIWEKNENEKSSLISLGQAGIGAIYLSAINSGLTYSSAIHENYARLKESSIYLKESGKAGLITSVDFAK